jgi:hypothetical protein
MKTDNWLLPSGLMQFSRSQLRKLIEKSVLKFEQDLQVCAGECTNGIFRC